jgi:outer membrane immunogenic protein
VKPGASAGLLRPRARVSVLPLAGLPFYPTGGGSIAASSPASPAASKAPKPGCTAGAGVEAAFTDNWTARIEYLFVDLQSATCNTTQCGFPVGDTIKFSANMIRIGLDYKLR